jgi:hypothetical protein
VKSFLCPFLLFSSVSFADLQVDEKNVFYDVASESKETLLSTQDEESFLYDKKTNHGETQNAWLYQHFFTTSLPFADTMLKK